MTLRDSRKKGVRSNLCEAPFGPFRQIGPDPFFLPATLPQNLELLYLRIRKAESRVFAA
jgi:hypothetical protein